MYIWFDNVKEEYAKFDLERWANIVFLNAFLHFVEKNMLEENFDPNDIYQTDDWKEFIKDRIEYFYNYTNFLQRAKEFFEDMLG